MANKNFTYSLFIFTFFNLVLKNCLKYLKVRTKFFRVIFFFRVDLMMLGTCDSHVYDLFEVICITSAHLNSRTISKN